MPTYGRFPPMLVFFFMLSVLNGCRCSGMVISQSGAKDGGSGTGTSPGSCSNGSRCGDAGVCAGGLCCEAASACGNECCDSSEVCSFNRCVTPGKECRENGECDSNDFCDYSATWTHTADAGTSSNGLVCVGEPIPPGRCLNKPPLCEEGQTFFESGECIEMCRFQPAALPFGVKVNHSWASGDVMMTPIVTQLDDDNCDGAISASDMPDIVFNAFHDQNYGGYGTTHALTVKDGALVQKWSRSNVFLASSQLASGNIDQQKGNEVVGCGFNRLLALRGDGTTLWDVSAINCNQLSVADLDADGTVEVVTDFQIFDGATGAVKATFPQSASGHVVADINGDAKLDIVGAGLAFQFDGTLLADTGQPGTFAGIADFDLDGKPEMVTVQTNTHSVFLWGYDAASTGKAKVIRSPIDINGPLNPARCSGYAGETKGGGPPTVGDFNGDGFPDLALAGGVGYAVMDGKKLLNPAVAGADTFLWTRETKDCSSAATGSSLFDFDGDGNTEVVYADEDNLHIYDSATGADRVSVCNRNGTLVEFPVVADIDNDGQADLIVTSNSYHGWTCSGTPTRGIRIFGSLNSNWVSTRRIWNQHAYSYTNIEEDGTVPRIQKPNWLEPGLNNFRQQKQPGFEFAASDAVAQIDDVCIDKDTLRIVVRNLGEAPLPPGIRVAVLKGDALPGVLLGTVVTTRTLGPAQAQVLPLAIQDEQVIASEVSVFTQVLNAPRDCRPDNNVSEPVKILCTFIN